MGDYVQTTARDIASMRAAACDLLLTLRMAHRIKGAARLVGAQRIEEIAAGVEARAGANSLMPGAVEHAARQLADALEAVKTELRALAAQQLVACTVPGGSGRVWLNRYGYLSDQKLHEVGKVLRRCRAQLA